MSADVIGHDTEDTAAEGTLLCETVYYADGTRAGVTTPDDGYWTTRYIGSLIYEGEPGQETLEGVSTDYGFIQWNGSAASSRMQYFLRDHLGSVRVIAEDRHTVISRTDYLPFGVRMSGDGLTAGNPTARSSFFGFSGKENEMWGGLNTAEGDITPHWLKGERYQHFGARAYDPVSCIFMQVDPMAEKYYGMTPYGYCAGNPVMMVDPDGNFPETLWDIANVVLDVTSLVSNIKQGNSKAAIADGAGLVLDVAAMIIPVIPGGAGTALKAARGADKAADVVKAADKATDASSIAKNTARGRQSEARVLEDIGATKNTKVHEANVNELSVKTIPDSMDGAIIEIKDVKAQYNTTQIKAERQLAKDLNMDFFLYVGDNTHVSKKIPTEEIVRRPDLGPKSK